MSLESVLDRSDQAAPVPHAGTAPYHILVADDQREVLEAIRLLLTGHDCSVAGATSPDGALDLATSETFDAALIDLNYGKGLTSGEQGLDLVSALVGEAPTLPIVVMTAWGSMDLAVEAVRRGARDLVEKPWDEERLAGMLRSHAELGRALRRIRELESEVRQLSTPPAPADDIPPIDTMRLHDVEGILVRHAMTRHQGNVSRAARTLGLSRSALYRRLERHRMM